LHMAQLMPLPLAVSCFSKIQIGFTFLVPAHPGSPGQRAVKRVYVCVCVQHADCSVHDDDGCYEDDVDYSDYPADYMTDAVVYKTDVQKGQTRDWPMSAEILLVKETLVISKGMRAVKLCTDKILRLLAGGVG